MNEQKTEVRNRFKKDATNSTTQTDQHLQNELVYQIKPYQAVYMTISNKEPGIMKSETIQTKLDLTYDENHFGVFIFPV